MGFISGTGALGQGKLGHDLLSQGLLSQGLLSQGLISQGASVYFVGIKGSGACALAELLHGAGAKIAGSDVPEAFYTDAILRELGIPVYEGFDRARIGGGIGLVVHSAAYGEENEEIAEARSRGIPVAPYPRALGAYSAGMNSAGVAGVHGKTTTTAMCGSLAQALGLPAQILVGSAAAGFGGRATLNLGGKYFIAETCEYRRHFLEFRPRRIALTSVESDHQDCFPTCESIREAFIDYCRLLPPGGQLIYCADDPGASSVAGAVSQEGRGIELIPYGFSAQGDYRIGGYRVCAEAEGTAAFSAGAFSGELRLRVPGRHQAQNAAAALALIGALLKEEFGEGWSAERQAAAQKALEEFAGTKRRSEIVGSAGGIIFMDDYGHHPTAIRATLEGLREFYPARRIVASFMPHTFSRTAALLGEFAEALSGADALFLHKIYASARERFDGSIDGMALCDKAASLRGDGGAPFLHYADEPLDALEPLKEYLRPGDLFLTLGAGSNWPLGIRLFEHFRGAERHGNNSSSSSSASAAEGGRQ